MKKISDEEWVKAKKHALEMKKMAESLRILWNILCQRVRRIFVKVR